MGVVMGPRRTPDKRDRIRFPAMPAGAVFVLPTLTAGQQGPVAAFVSTAGWAGAAQRVLGASWIVTPSGVITPDDARRRASQASLASPPATSRGRGRKAVPVVVKTAVKDLREFRRARAFHAAPAGPWTGTDLAFVWQRHELFHTAGIRLASALRVPSVVFVPATLVWQAREWGVRRPGWSRAAEHFGEAVPLRSADVVACGTDAVVREVVNLGVDRKRIVVTPTGVDIDLFSPGANTSSAAAIRTRLGIERRFVVGWVGSFRRFHALDQAVDALAGADNVTLLLIGDGPERRRIEELARAKNVDVVCTGTVDHHELPAYLAAMDVALVLAQPGAEFHYSPLKLAEYLAAGIAVVVPRAGVLPSRLTDGVDAILVEPGDTAGLRSALLRLRDDPVERVGLGRAGRAAAVARWSWDQSVQIVLDHLADPDAVVDGA
jgi:glycosyltransferase involved in cell wall biosynthesis